MSEGKFTSKERAALMVQYRNEFGHALSEEQLEALVEKVEATPMKDLDALFADTRSDQDRLLDVVECITREWQLLNREHRTGSTTLRAALDALVVAAKAPLLEKSKRGWAKLHRSSAMMQAKTLAARYAAPEVVGIVTGMYEQAERCYCYRAEAAHRDVINDLECDVLYVVNGDGIVEVDRETEADRAARGV